MRFLFLLCQFIEAVIWNGYNWCIEHGLNYFNHKLFNRGGGFWDRISSFLLLS